MTSSTKEIKKDLIAHGPEQIGAEKFCGLLSELAARFEAQPSDAETVLLVDTLAIWFLRATQWAGPEEERISQRGKETETNKETETETETQTEREIETETRTQTLTQTQTEPQESRQTRQRTKASGSGAPADPPPANPLALSYLQTVDPELLTRLFSFVCDFHHARGRLANAVSALLSRLILFAGRIAPPLLCVWLRAALQLPRTQKGAYAVLEALLRALHAARLEVRAHRPEFLSQCVDAMAQNAVAHAAARAAAAVFLHSPPDQALASWTPELVRGLKSPRLRANVEAHLLPALFRPYPQHFAQWAASLQLDARSALALLEAGRAIDAHFDAVSSGAVSPLQLRAWLTHAHADVRHAALGAALAGIRAGAAPRWAVQLLQDADLLEALFRHCETPSDRTGLLSALRRPVLAMRDFVRRARKDEGDRRAEMKNSLDEKSSGLKRKDAQHQLAGRKKLKGNGVSDAMEIDPAKQAQKMESNEVTTTKKQVTDTETSTQLTDTETSTQLIETETTTTDTESTPAEVEDALCFLKNFILSLLIPDSTYSQLCLAFGFLDIFVSQGFDGVSRSKNSRPHKVFIIFDTHFTDLLLRFTTNNYEDIRLHAKTLLFSTPFAVFKETIQKQPQQNLPNSMALLSSRKGRQSEGGAQLFLAVTTIYQLHGDYTSFFETTNALVQGLNVQISAGGASHGYFTTLALIFSSLEKDTLLSHKDYFSSIIVSLLETILQIWDMLKYLMALAPSEVDSDTETDSWRLIKESSFLLRTIMALNHQHGWIFLSEDHFLSLCDMVISQLTNVTHRGAFLAIFPTFVQACEICLDSSLSDKPEQWLLSNIRLIETKTQLVSRRSAGLPFLITGVLDASVSAPKTLQEFLKITFDELLGIANLKHASSADEKMDLPQVHAFNCIKHIFSDSALGSAVLPYINDALILSLSNLDNPTWAIKNGAVMLFTSLQGKLFGSSTVADGASGTNASLFFHKYPGIKEILREKLGASRSLNQANVVIPILAVLSRLHTFVSSDLSLDVFIDELKNTFLKHHLWKIREMSALLISRMLHESRLLDCISELLLCASESTNNNEVHGALCCIKECLKRVPKTVDLGGVSKSVESQFRYNISAGKRHFSILSAYLHILKVTQRLSRETAETLAEHVLKEIELLKYLLYPDGTKQLYLSKASVILLEYYAKEKTNTLRQLTWKFLQAYSVFEVPLACANFFIEHPELVQEPNRMKTLLASLINDTNLWTPVKSTFLQLIISLGGTVSDTITPEAKWPDEMIERWLVITGDTQDSMGVTWFVESVVSFADDHQPEEKIELAVMAAGKFIAANYNVVSANVARMQFLVFRKLFDDSSRIRNLASALLTASSDSNLCSTLVAKKFLQSFTLKFGKYAITILTEHIFTLINNLNDAIAEKQNEMFDVERSNLFINEVSFHGTLVRAILPYIDISTRDGQRFEQCVVQEIQNLAHFLSTHPNMVQTCSFNLHVDTAIRKVMNYKTFCTGFPRVKSQLDNLQTLLKSFGYFI